MSSDPVGDVREVGQLLCDFDLLGREFTQGQRKLFVDAFARAFTELAKTFARSGTVDVRAVFRSRGVWRFERASPLSRCNIRLSRVFARPERSPEVIDLEDLLRDVLAGYGHVGPGND